MQTKSSKQAKRVTGLIVVLITGLIGVVLLLKTQASTVTASIEAEQGSASQVISRLTDTSASNGGAVRFGSGTPSGLAMPDANAYPGYNLALSDDFTGTSLNQTKWNGFYQDINQQYGPFLRTHGKVANGMITMSDYVDTAANGASSGTSRAGTGLASRSTWTSGIALVRARADAGVGVTMCLGIIGYPDWPPEIDFYEDGRDTTNVRHQFNVGTIYGPTKHHINGTNPAVDATQWHTYGVQWNETSISYLVDGVAWSTIPNPQPTGTNGLSLPQMLFMQIETLVGGANTVPVNATTPPVVDMNVDWAVIYT